MRGPLVLFIFMTGCAQVGIEGQLEERPMPPLTPPPAWRLTQGEALYVRHCSDCHGWQGRGNGPVGRMLGIKAPNLRRAELFTDRSEDEFLAWVLHSEPLSVVPDAARLTPTEEDIDAIAAYMRRLPHIPRSRSTQASSSMILSVCPAMAFTDAATGSWRQGSPPFRAT